MVSEEFVVVGASESGALEVIVLTVVITVNIIVSPVLEVRNVYPATRLVGVIYSMLLKP